MTRLVERRAWKGVEKADDGRFWNVTFSYPTPAGGNEIYRDDATVKVRDENSEFIGAQSGVLIGQS